MKTNEFAGAIGTITADSAKIKVVVDEIRAGSIEQARGVEQISHPISQMEQVTQTTAAGAEESASAAEELNAQAEALKQVGARIRYLVQGQANLGETAASMLAFQRWCASQLERSLYSYFKPTLPEAMTEFRVESLQNSISPSR